MKKQLLCITLPCLFIYFNLFSTSYNVFGQTSIPSGNVNGLWTPAGSPYLIQGNIQIQDGQTLTINPGVTVNFQGAYRLNVQGRLIATGTLTDSISFTATDTTNGWGGIRFASTPTTNDTTKINYCKLQYGKATGASPNDKGGAIYIENFPKVIISNCKISHCLANSSGGGIYCTGGAIITYNSISKNSTFGMYGGGGIYCDGDALITNNTIIYNRATVGYGYGGGIYAAGGVKISDNIISNNNGLYGGGLMYWGGNANISNNIISNNLSSGMGGGIYDYSGGNRVLSNNTIANNKSGSLGGGIYINGYSNPFLSNNSIINNSAQKGGGIYCNWSDPILINNTISNNSATNGGAVYCDQTSKPTFRNCILWGNTATTSGSQVFLFDDPSDPNFYFCNIQGGSAAFNLNGNIYTGTYLNNIDSDPLFISSSGGSGILFNGITANWALQNISPCIDTGDPTTLTPSTDKAGNPRVTICRIDIGAYEYQSGLPFMTSILQTGSILCNGYATGALQAIATNGTLPYSYLWAPGGATTSSISNLIAGSYTLNINEAGGCSRTETKTIAQPNVNAPPSSACLVTVDSLSQFNIIIWDKTAYTNVDSFIIYREVQSTVYKPVGAVHFDSASLFIDTVRTKYFIPPFWNLGDPNAGTYRYKIAARDTCGDYGTLSPYHNTIFMTNNNGMFSWPQLYTIEGNPNPVNSYLLMRDNFNNGNWTVVNSVTGSQQSVTDPAYATWQSTANWRIETQWNISCTPTIKNPYSMTSFNSTLSNTHKPTITTNTSSYNYDHNLSIYPNPTSGSLQINNLQPGISELIIYNVMGEKMYSDKIINQSSYSLNPELPNGVYFLKVRSDEGTANKKIIIHK